MGRQERQEVAKATSVDSLWNVNGKARWKQKNGLGLEWGKKRWEREKDIRDKNKKS